MICKCAVLLRIEYLKKRRCRIAPEVASDLIYLVKQEQRIVDRDEYLQAWFEYWDDIASGLNSFDAIANMRTDHGGVARKQPIPEINGIYNEKIERMLSYIQQSIEDEG
jgi:hypothetical protein